MTEPKNDANAAEGQVPASSPNVQSLETMSSSYVTAMSHFYRGEMARTLVWRQRLDPTTNWALVTSAAFISVAFSERSIPHLIFVPCFLLLHVLVLIEARRYRFYDAWRARLRIIEAHFLVPVVLENTSLLQGNWRKLLAEDLLIPSYKMSRMEAIGRRLKRNYIWIFMVILSSWGAKIALVSSQGDEALEGVGAFMNALVGDFSPSWVPVVTFAFAVFEVLVITIWVATLEEYSGDIGPRRRDARAWRV